MSLPLRRHFRPPPDERRCLAVVLLGSHGFAGRCPYTRTPGSDLCGRHKGLETEGGRQAHREAWRHGMKPSFAVGERVEVLAFRRWRLGRVVALGRVRITVDYETRNGQRPKLRDFQPGLVRKRR